LAAAATLILPDEAWTQNRSLVVAPGVTVSHPANWAVAPRAYDNAHELLAPAKAVQGGATQARILITLERRRDPAEAVRRLAEIAAEVPGSPPAFLQISGWPALQRRYQAPFAQRGQVFRPGGAEQVLTTWSTTAIAAGTLLVRLEATLVPGAPAALVTQAESIGRSVAVTPRGDPARSQVDIDRLKVSPQVAPAVRPQVSVPPAASTPVASSPLPGARVILSPLRSAVAAPVRVQGGLGELQIAASADGRNVVVSANSGTSVSNNAGGRFNAVGLGVGFQLNGDPTAAVGTSGNFYLGFIGFPNGTPAARNATGCSTSLTRSVNNGVNFAFLGHAVVCPNGMFADTLCEETCRLRFEDCMQAARGNNSREQACRRQQSSCLADCPPDPPRPCFPDQPQIGADRLNAGAGGADQLYSVWRNFVPGGAARPACAQITSGFVTPAIVCSSDGGASWTAPRAIGTGDFPRVTVGPDGAVYALYRSNANVMLQRFSSCASGLAPQPGFPVTVATISDVACPVAGLDRCGNLSSPVAAVDDLDARHVYVAFAHNTAAGNEDVLVQHSTDGGLSWSPGVRVNGGLRGRRFMPWVCTAGGAAYVSWYDRRQASVPPADDRFHDCVEFCREDLDDCVLGARGDDGRLRQCSRTFNTCKRNCGQAAPLSPNDLTGYFLGTAVVENGVLRAGPEVNLSGVVDAQCASGWPCVPSSAGDAESCSVQPQVAGVCCVLGPQGCPGSLQPCDFSSTACPAGETCNASRGCPKYGDYNGNACAGGRVFTAWASATAPARLPPVGQITIFSEATVAPSLTVTSTVVPGNDPGRFDVRVDGIVRASDLAHGGSTGALVVAPGTRRVSVGAGTNTVLANYTRAFGGACAPDGTVPLGLGDARTCTVTHTRLAADSRQVCLNSCEQIRRLCLEVVEEEEEGEGAADPDDCGRNYERCAARCPAR
jgi:hypothetical protein